jgi:hypothetical protein
METPASSVRSTAKLPASKRSSYQFPVYRWIGWLTVAGYAVGLTAMFFVAGLFGIPAPLGWAFLVILFVLGALLLDHPKLLLAVMMFYFMLMPSNRLFGLIGLPLPTFLDELFFLPFIAVIVMNWIQRRQLKEATVFPIAFCLLAALSWYVNGKGYPFTAVQVTLVMLKPYILWYYCRLTCTFENEQHALRWMWLIILYAASQYLYNIIWQRGLWPTYHPDVSGGVFGPEGMGGAHLVGYLSVFALFLLAGWWIGAGREASRRRKWGAALLVLVIGYDLVFMTDTKHALLFAPIAFLPFLFRTSLPVKLRIGMFAGGGVFVVASAFYFTMFSGRLDLMQNWQQMKYSPKGEMFAATTMDFPHLVPFPLLGAGPGRFCSDQAVNNKMPLARRYVIPYRDEAERRMLTYGATATRTGASQLAWPQSDFFTLVGEFGWIGASVYFGFWGWTIWKLLGKANLAKAQPLVAGMYLALACCLIFMVFVILFIKVVTIPVLSFPLWMLVGRTWDMKAPRESVPEEAVAG